tara:strand:- start:1885 stop:2946 length:1062 start_codon:yes stop_codon:yes gene_type:complete
LNHKVPFVSVIMPIRNEIAYIDLVLDAIIRQSYGLTNYEVLIADGLSNDGTYDIIRYYQKKYDNVKLILNYEKIVPTGFNKALSVAKGSIITRVDGHTIISKDFIKNSIDKLIEMDCSCVGGSIENISIGNIAHSINIAQSSTFGVGGVAFRQKNLNGKFVDTLAFGSYKREIFDQIGGYDEELIRNQDDEFNFRLVQNGEKIWLDPSISSKYYNRSNYRMLFSQYFYYGFYKIRVFQKRKSFSSYRHLIPLAFILAIVVGIVLAKFFENILPLKVLILVYFFFALIFATIETAKIVFKKNSLKIIYYPILVIFAFLTLHVSYGIGLLSGLFYFRNKWQDSELKDKAFVVNSK